jgi:hypothetical protein
VYTGAARKPVSTYEQAARRILRYQPAAEQIKKMAKWPRTTTPKEVTHDIKGYAKNQLAVVVAAYGRWR